MSLLLWQTGPNHSFYRCRISHLTCSLVLPYFLGEMKERGATAAAGLRFLLELQEKELLSGSLKGGGTSVQKRSGRKLSRYNQEVTKHHCDTNQEITEEPLHMVKLIQV